MISKNLRLKNTQEIKNVFADGKSTRCGFLFLKYLSNNSDFSRFAVSVGMSFSKSAVKRNLLKRRIRAVLNENAQNIKEGFDCVVFVRSNSSEKPRSAEIESALVECLQKAQLIKNI